MPQRIQRKRTKGWRMPEGAIYVGRPTKWGNPFAFGVLVQGVMCDGQTADVRADTHKHAVQAFRRWMDGLWLVSGTEPPPFNRVATELAGHDLACWCPLDQACHADVLLEIANRGTQ